MKIKLKFILIIGLMTISFAGSVRAVTLYFQPDQGEYSKGDTFLVNLKIDTEKEIINAAQIELEFPSDKLEVVEISRGNSIFTFWPEEPSFSNKTGKISFVGGVPLGFEGEGTILTVAFRVILNETEKSFAEIIFSPTSQVLLNDGKGSRVEFQTKKAVFSLSSKEAKFLKNEWEEELRKDKIPPESFEIILDKNPLIFDGKYFIAFQTVDNQTGIDRYEIKEGKKPWKEGKSPYLLEDQTLSSKVLVKAIDKAGNERIAELPPIFPRKPLYKISQFWIITIISFIIIGILIYFLFKKLKKNRF